MTYPSLPPRAGEYQLSLTGTHAPIAADLFASSIQIRRLLELLSVSLLKIGIISAAATA